MATTTFTDGVTLTAASWFNDVDTATYCQLTGVAGTNTITAGGPANITLSSRQIIWLVPANTNTGATTLNITPSGGAALGAKNVFANNAACTGGELVAGIPYALIYDGTQYQILGVAAPRGSFTATATGMTASITGTAKYRVVNGIVRIFYPVLTGTSNTTTLTITGAPAALQPATAKGGILVIGVDNGTNNTARADVGTDGVITLYTTVSGGAWTNSGTKGLPVATELSYTLD